MPAAPEPPSSTPVPSATGTPSAQLPQGTPSDPPLPGPQPPGGPGSWPSIPIDSRALERGLSAMLPIMAGAVVVMGLTLLLRPPRRPIG